MSFRFLGYENVLEVPRRWIIQCQFPKAVGLIDFDKIAQSYC